MQNAIEMRALCRSFDGFKAVDEVSLSIPKGEIFGYLGPNGAGKTTTVKMLTGMLPPDSGEIRVGGFDLADASVDAKRLIGYVPESGALYQSLTPLEYLLFVGRLYSMDDQAIHRRILEVARFFGLEGHLNQRMASFSKGMKQKVVIASALIHNPEILFLDEPLNGLDANAAMMLKELIRSLAAEGRTVFYCSHILEVVENLCTRVAIIHQGKIVADGSMAELKEMTRRNSLSDVFQEITHAGDLSEAARAFSKSLTEAPSS